MKKEILEEALQTKKGFKEIMHGMFSFFRRKNSYKIYSIAEQKGVRENIIIKSFNVGEKVYAIMAFSIKDNFDPESIRKLKEDSEVFTLGTVRQECLKYNDLQRWKEKGFSIAYKNGLIRSLSNVNTGFFVYPVMYKRKQECKYVVFAKLKAELYIYPIKDKLFDIKFFAINYLIKVKSLQRHSPKSAL